MIQITCTSCKRVLSIDDAFAGGVCRCQYCGTIQTVGARAGAPAAASAARGPKTLFENKARGGVGSGSGLEDLADVLHSSGLADAAHRKPLVSPPAAPQKNLVPLLGISAAVIVALLASVLLLVMRSNGNSASAVAPSSASPSIQSSAPPFPAAPVSPSFCNLPIDQSVVVYLIDNGSSSADVLDTVKTVLFKSIESLGPDRRFQIIFWNPDTDPYPSSHTAFAVKDNIDVARKKLDDVTASGATDPLMGLKTALADEPGQIIIVTAKAGDLDDSLIAKVTALRGTSTARIDCIAVNGVENDKVLAKIAQQSGGKFVPISAAQLRTYAF
jgi:hypothetical protein